MQQTPFTSSPLYAPFAQPAMPMRASLPNGYLEPASLLKNVSPLNPAAPLVMSMTSPTNPASSISMAMYPPMSPNTMTMAMTPPMNPNAMTMVMSAPMNPTSMTMAMSPPMTAYTVPSFGNAIPAAELVKSKLTIGQGLKEGLTSGALFSLIASVPIWLIEKMKKDESLIHMLSRLIEAPIMQFKGSTELKFTNRIAAWPHFAQSMGSTVLIGLMAGSALGPWIVNTAKKKLVDINQMKTEQQQGTFQPKPLTVLQTLGLQKKPSNDPAQDYQDLLQDNLSTAHAFKQGATTVLLAKVIPGLLSLGGTLACVYGVRRWGSDALKKSIQGMSIEGKTIEEYLKKTMLHPVVLAKMAALPIMGGFIAQQTVPWMKRQIGIENQ